MTATTSSAPRTARPRRWARCGGCSIERRAAGFGWCVVASVGIALIELAGLVVIIPLLSILADGTLPKTGCPARSSGGPVRATSTPSCSILTAVAFGFFVLRAIATLVLRWWIFGRIFEDEAATSARLLHRFLSAPYAYHLRTNSTQLLRTLTFSVDQTYSKVIVGLLTIATELIVAVATVFLLARERAARRSRAAVLLRRRVRHHQPGDRGAQPAGRPCDCSSTTPTCSSRPVRRSGRSSTSSSAPTRTTSWIGSPTCAGSPRTRSASCSSSPRCRGSTSSWPSSSASG